MGKKGLTSIFSKLPAGADEPSPPWPWPSCRNPQTASFREEERRRPCRTAAAVSRSPAAAARLIHGGAGEMYKTVNSVYQLDYISADGSCFDEEEEEEGQGVLELDDDDGFSTTTASEEWSEAVIRSLGRTSTDRFFVDPPGPASNSILALSPGKQSAAQADEAEEKPQSEPIASTSLVEESVAVAVDSEDPYGDFRASMEEMVAAHGLRGWEALEELLVWYLRINGKHNHALIVGAFVDLLVGLAAPPASSSSAAPTTTTTATTMTTTSASGGSGSTASTSTSSSTCGCEGDVTPATTTTEEQCGDRNGDASRSPASSSHSLQGKDEEDLAGDKAGDDDLSITRSAH
ncbi:transcription repressor OFP13-like [Triticum urartu]|uniref:transcription repressor OFP13-like n=1 Tax=Triticum urartu TaxID=4572 RepID=UPI0020443123|nr:transcription repressor OFP13-like [Triticum urartu]